MKTEHLSLSFYLILFVLFTSCNSRWNIENPYEQVNWEKDKQYKANLHTHTTISDGHLPPQFVVDWYYQNGYSILAITDHNKVTYPWTDFSSLEASAKSQKKVADGLFSPEAIMYENRSPKELGMVAVQGNEVSSPQHIGSLFSDFGVRTSHVDSAMIGIGEKNGLIIFNHPGRYEPNAQWYADFCKKYSHIIGLEIYNNGDRYPNDRQLWDSVLVAMLPNRPLWAYSNDDMHQQRSLGRNWNIFILPELTEESVRKGIEKGCSFYVYAPDGHKRKQIPEIQSVIVDQRKGLIQMHVSGQDSIHWLSGGKIIQKGSSIKLNDCPELSSYVRAEIFGESGFIMGTQPFSIQKK